MPTASRDPRHHPSIAEPEYQPGGRFLLRMPLSLHKQASLAAASEGVSLNQFVFGVLAAAVQWEANHGEQRPRERRYPKSRDELARELWGVDVLRD